LVILIRASRAALGIDRVVWLRPSQLHIIRANSRVVLRHRVCGQSSDFNL
jgi:hypothetical protein